MNPIANAALTSWAWKPLTTAILLSTALIYLRGWVRGRRLLRDPADWNRLGAFVAGLGTLFLALESPLDSFDNLFLSAHMAQHLLLMMIAPPLILMGHPLVPTLRGLPRQFVKEGLGPFLTWRALRQFCDLLTAPVFSWFAFAFSTLFWHMPKFYELALRSPEWHNVQHASFFWTGILFWWPIVQPGAGKPRWPRWAKIPYLLFADIVNTALSAFFVFSGRLLYPTYSAIYAGGLGPQEDQTFAGLIMWVPGSLIYLVPAFVIAMRVLSSPQLLRPATAIRVVRSERVRGKDRLPALVRWRRVAQTAMLLVAVAVMADGFFGPRVAALNLAGVLPWIHWRALSILALIAVGNLFCMACPFTLVRDFSRKIWAGNLRWPRPLRNKWIPAALLLVYLWTYEAFSLWDSPWITAWIIAGYFGAAIVLDGFFRRASFCKYVCPIGQFHFVSSLLSPREIGVKRPETCRACTTHDCIRGNETVRGCELYLFQPKKSGNLDCTFCLDCVKACPHENIGLISIAPAKSLLTDSYRSSLGRLSKRTDVAALVLLFVFGAFVNAAGMVTPVMEWEHRWHAQLGRQAMPLIVGAFVLTGAALLPAFVTLVCAWLNRFAVKESETRDFVRRCVLALVPIGAGMWASHLAFHIATGWSAFWPAVQRIFSGSVQFAAPTISGWLTPLQILLLDAGLLLTLYTIWKIARGSTARLRAAITLTAPWAIVSCALYVAGIWILFQPMQMRGMLH
ncbi:MAG: cytochrome c oxidase assembly protein [Acidobacteriaceae bacterium]|nr:cytochrome c oxidase assembly protein [Acidobacteriaceae bacterium]